MSGAELLIPLYAYMAWTEAAILFTHLLHKYRNYILFWYRLQLVLHSSKGFKYFKVNFCPLNLYILACESVVKVYMYVGILMYVLLCLIVYN
jgi:hypothetical protein